MPWRLLGTGTNMNLHEPSGDCCSPGHNPQEQRAWLQSRELGVQQRAMCPIQRVPMRVCPCVRSS